MEFQTTTGRRTMYGGIVARLSQTERRTSTRQPADTLTSEEIDSRCQLILSEIERCKTFEDKYIESSVLHSVPQTFVPSELHVELSGELDRLLKEQLLREEKTHSTETIPAPRGSHATTTGTKVQADGCLARNSHCGWTPFCDADALARRRKVLYRELKLVERHDEKTPIQSVVPRSAINKGEITFMREELVKELSDEIQQIDSKLKLNLIDAELYQTYASTDESVSIRSIHGYDTTVKRQDAIWALEHEHNRHIGQIVAVETIDSILEW